MTSSTMFCLDLETKLLHFCLKSLFCTRYIYYIHDVHYIHYSHSIHYITYGLQVSLKLDIAQDKIMLANTRLSVATAVIGFAAYFTGTYVRTSLS